MTQVPAPFLTMVPVPCSCEALGASVPATVPSSTVKVSPASTSNTPPPEPTLNIAPAARLVVVLTFTLKLLVVTWKVAPLLMKIVL